MSMTPEQTRARAQLAARKRWHGDNAEITPQIEQLKQAAVDRHVAALVAAFKQATPDQVDRLRALVAPLFAAEQAARAESARIDATIDMLNQAEGNMTAEQKLRLRSISD